MRILTSLTRGTQFVFQPGHPEITREPLAEVNWEVFNDETQTTDYYEGRITYKQGFAWVGVRRTSAGQKELLVGREDEHPEVDGASSAAIIRLITDMYRCVMADGCVSEREASEAVVNTCRLLHESTSG